MASPAPQTISVLGIDITNRRNYYFVFVFAEDSDQIYLHRNAGELPTGVYKSSGRQTKNFTAVVGLPRAEQWFSYDEATRLVTLLDEDTITAFKNL